MAMRWKAGLNPLWLRLKGDQRRQTQGAERDQTEGSEPPAFRRKEGLIGPVVTLRTLWPVGATTKASPASGRIT